MIEGAIGEEVDSGSADDLRLRVIRYFRLGKEAQANDALTKFVNCLEQLVASNPALLGVDESNLLSEMFSALQRGDTIYVADLLEYLIPQCGIGVLLRN